VADRFRHFYISVNYKADMVREALGDGSRWGAEIHYLQEDRPLGTAGPLSLIEAQPEHPLMVMNGDLITKISLGNLLTFHAESAAQATMAVREYEFEVPFGVVRVEGDRVAAIDEKPVQSFLVNAGLYVLEPEALRLLQPGERLDMPDLFRRVVARGDRAAVFPVQEYWLDIGRHDDFDRARDEFAREFPS
jgi:NDP-sugar pyrophosphorylase family protein